MDFGSFGYFEFTWQFISSFLMIIVIDLVLAGDNAVVIAMAVRNLSPRQRKIGIMLGAGGAVILRVCLTIVVASLLGIKGLKFCGGALIFWIALKLFIEGAPEEGTKKEPKTIWSAMVTIIIADIVMSLDNMLAVAGASHGNNLLIIFGLVLSIPFVVFTSSLLSMLMDKFPIIVYIGAMILGKVAGEMIITDPYVQSFLHTGKVTQYIVEAVGAVLVVVIGKLWMKMKIRKEETGHAH
ncbi:MAG: Integral membrane protein TerC family protein [Syntrophorhabdus sp. PtaU1.Bin050]|nr:MAG: Integral membrane protein TerC family protein [Syntrophorhabdus sp. PtaU1.Bin050]